MVAEGELLWTPRPEYAEASNMERYLRWLRVGGRCSAYTYDELWTWSVTETEAFWASLWDYFEIRASRRYDQVVDTVEMPGASWFAGSRLNYAEHMLRRAAEAPEQTALHHSSETRPLDGMSWAELARQVRVVATRLRVGGHEILPSGGQLISPLAATSPLH